MGDSTFLGSRFGGKVKLEWKEEKEGKCVEKDFKELNESPT